MTMPDHPCPHAAPLWRRLAAAAYDGLLLVALWLTATLLASVTQDLFGLGHSVHWARGLQIYLFILGLLMFGWFWTHGGQTPGLKAWQLRLQRDDGSPLRWPIAAVRYATMLVSWSVTAIPLLLLTPFFHHHTALMPAAWVCSGLFVAACLVSLIDPLHRSPQDFISGTRHVNTPRTRKPLAVPSAHAPQPPGREQPE